MSQIMRVFALTQHTDTPDLLAYDEAGTVQICTRDILTAHPHFNSDEIGTHTYRRGRTMTLSTIAEYHSVEVYGGRLFHTFTSGLLRIEQDTISLFMLRQKITGLPPNVRSGFVYEHHKRIFVSQHWHDKGYKISEIIIDDSKSKQENARLQKIAGTFDDAVRNMVCVESPRNILYFHTREDRIIMTELDWRGIQVKSRDVGITSMCNGINGDVIYSATVDVPTWRTSTCPSTDDCGIWRRDPREPSPEHIYKSRDLFSLHNPCDEIIYACTSSNHVDMYDERSNAIISNGDSLLDIPEGDNLITIMA